MTATPKESTMPQRAYPYSRFSCGKQRRGDSTRRQGEWYAEACARRRWVLDDTLHFFDRGRSAFRGKNSDVGDLGRFLDLVKRGRITPGSVLLVESLDRLSREEVGEAFELVRGILKAGITIATREPERVYRPGQENDMLTILEWLFIAARAHEESATKSMRVTKAWEAARAKAREGKRPINSCPPSWVSKTAAGYEFHPEHAEVMRRAVRLALDGAGCQTICEHMKAAGVPSPGRSGRWSPTFVRQVFRGRNLVGEYQPARGRGGNRPPSGPPIAGYYPALLTEDEWLRLQAALDGRRGKCGRPAKERVNLFTGLIKDAAGNALALHTCVRGGQSWRYLRLRGRDVTSVRYEDAEDCILDTLAMLRPEDVLGPSAQRCEREERIATLTNQVLTLDQRLSLRGRELDAEENPGLREQLKSSIRRLADEKDAAAKELQALKLESLTGRAEALTETQTLTQLRDEAKEKEERAKTEEERAEAKEEQAELDRRIKAALPSVVTEIVVTTARLSPRRCAARVRIQLRGGDFREVDILRRERGT